MSNRITIGCDKNELPVIRKFTSDLLDAHEVPDLQAHKLVLAVDEVCANIIIHANNCDTSNKIQLEIYFHSNHIEFIFRDKGVQFDINKYEAPPIHEIVETRRKGGLGLMLVKRIMDKIEFATEKNYNICRLIKTYP